MNHLISADDLQLVADAAEDFLSDAVEVRTDYYDSGFTGSQPCVGFVSSAPGLEFALGVAFARTLPDEAIEFGRPRTDSMGYGTIVYWPRVGLAQDEE